jgi:fatty-acyl-CoA synthase
MANPLELTIGGLLARAAARRPEGLALLDAPTGRRWSWAGLEAASAETARGLMALGLEPGDHLALWAPNQPEWVVCQLAAARAGLVLTNLDLTSTPEALADLLGRSGCRCLVAAPGRDGARLETLAELLPELHRPGRLASPRLPGLEQVVVLAESAPPAAVAWPELLARGRGADPAGLAAREAGLDPAGVACLFFTSGTTGAPKGVLCPHRGLVNTQAQSAANQGLGPDDRLCLSVPLAHVFGCACVSLCALAAGAALVIPSRLPEPGAALAAAAEHGCTALYGAPTSFIAMLELAGAGGAPASLRTGILAGAQVPLEVMRRTVEELGVEEVLVGYGQTESCTWITQTRPHDPLELRCSTVGRPLEGVEVRIVDPDTGGEAGPGQVGELCARGFNMLGYHQDPAATAQALDPRGWLHTGDLASRDREGFVSIAGRLKEVIRSGGRAVFPSQVEEALFAHPAVADAQAFGVPHPELGQEVAVWVRLKQGRQAAEAELMEFAAGRLAEARRPRHLKIVDAFPLTQLGKVKKLEMAETYARELAEKKPSGA